MSAVTYPEVGIGVTATASVDVRKRLAWWMLFLASFGFIAGGLYTVARGYDARSEVRAQLASEKIVTAEDSAIPGVPVNDHRTAHAQADVIQKHTLAITGGKTYAELPREDPNRETAFRGAVLRTSLMSAALAWHTADLAMGIGAFIASVGIILLIAVLLLRPKRNE